MMYRIVNGILAISSLELQTTSSVTRGHMAQFLLPYARTSIFLDSARIWSSLPQPLVDSTSLDAFKHGVMSCSIP